MATESWAVFSKTLGWRRVAPQYEETIGTVDACTENVCTPSHRFRYPDRAFVFRDARGAMRQFSAIALPRPNLLNLIGASVRTLQQVLGSLYFHFLSENFSEHIQFFTA
jgi:hypothetical protein